MSAQPWWQVTDEKKLDTPALLIYPGRVKQNIAACIAMLGNDTSRLRPHVKTSKSADAIKLLLEAGVQKFKCATIAEAELLAICKAADVLLAYQPVGVKIERFIKLLQAYPGTRFSCLVDNRSSAEQLSQAAIAHTISPDIYIDLNVGMNRTGIAPGNEAFVLYTYAHTLPGISLKGLHAYDGHINHPDPAVRKEEVQVAFAPVFALAAQLTASGLPQPVIIAGGSPSFPFHAADTRVECSPGTFVYWDQGYATQLKEQPFVPAALVAATVVSFPAPGKICIDLGHKAIAAESELSKRAFFLNAPMLNITGHSEEHMILEHSGAYDLKVGDILYALPWHICPTVALHDTATTVVDQQLADQWITDARTRHITI